MFRALKKLLGQVQLCCFYNQQTHFQLSPYFASKKSLPNEADLKMYVLNITTLLFVICNIYRNRPHVIEKLFLRVGDVVPHIKHDPNVVRLRNTALNGIVAST